MAVGITPESNIPSTKRMGMNSSGTLTNASSRLVTINPASETKRIGLRPTRPDQVPIGVLKRNIPRPNAPSIKASISDPSPRACKRCGKTGRITEKPVIIRVTQPIRNTSATLIERDFLAGEAAIDLALTIFSRGRVSWSRSLVAIWFVLSDLTEGGDNVAFLTSSTPALVVLFPSCTYRLQIASVVYITVLPDHSKTGNRLSQICHKKTARLTTRTLLLFQVRRFIAFPLREVMLDELANKALLAYKNGAAVLHCFTNEADHFLSIGLH